VRGATKGTAQIDGSTSVLNGGAVTVGYDTANAGEIQVTRRAGSAKSTGGPAFTMMLKTGGSTFRRERLLQHGR